MINFNGVDLESIAPVKIDDIVVAPIETAPVARQRAVSFGADFVRMGPGVGVGGAGTSSAAVVNFTVAGSPY